MSLTGAEVLFALLLSLIPLSLNMWAMLDAARRPEWAFALADRSRTAWVAAAAVGILFCVPGVLIALWYLLRVRPLVAAAESGRFRT